VARDLLNDDAHIFLIDDREEYKDVKKFVEMLAPEFTERVQHYTGKTPIFQAFGVDRELAHIRQQRIDLPVRRVHYHPRSRILCAIDVNTGKFIGHKSQEETVTATNLEAADEVAKQLRIRNIGGIIVIDFIDMRRNATRSRWWKFWKSHPQRSGENQNFPHHAVGPGGNDPGTPTGIVVVVVVGTLPRMRGIGQRSVARIHVFETPKRNFGNDPRPRGRAVKNHVAPRA
jgi:hypothetical protein